MATPAVARYDVFLSHSSADKPAVEELARRLELRGVHTWLDTWHLVPGEPWQDAIEEALAGCASCAVFVGPGGAGPWQNEEMRVAIDRRVQEPGRRFRVIPVLLPGAERGERSRLPAFLSRTTWVEFRGTLDDEAALHRLVSGVRGTEPGPDPGRAVHEGICPYRGLEVFDVGDARFFAGREALTEWLLDALRPAANGPREANRFLAIVGASGSGKSSLARAGLLAALREGKLGGSAAWLQVVCRPGADPLENLAVALCETTGSARTVEAVRGLIRDLAEDDRALHLTARLALGAAPADRRFVVLVDQFEEVFTLCRDEAPRRALIANLLHAATTAEGRTVVLLTLRADFYGRCAPYPELAAALSEHQLLVGPMAPDEQRRAIELPAQLTGCAFEPGLVEALLEDVAGQAGGLPLLQHALLELWHRRAGRVLTHAAYREIGGVAGALERRAEAVYGGLSAPEQELCRQIFLRLTQPGEGTGDTRRRVPLQDLLPLTGERGRVEAVVRTLAGGDARLVTTEGGANAGDEFVEVAHEALIRGWARLGGWINEDRAGLLAHRRLTEAAKEWRRLGQDEGLLYRGARLAEAQEWRARNEGVLNESEETFLNASSALQDREEEERKERQLRELAQKQALADEQRERAAAESQRLEERRRREAVVRVVRGAIVTGIGYGAAFALISWSGPRDADPSRVPDLLEQAVPTFLVLLSPGVLAGFALGMALWHDGRPGVGRLTIAGAAGLLGGLLVGLMFFVTTHSLEPDRLLLDYALGGALIGAGSALGASYAGGRPYRPDALLGALLAALILLAIGLGLGQRPEATLLAALLIGGLTELGFGRGHFRSPWALALLASLVLGCGSPTPTPVRPGLTTDRVQVMLRHGDTEASVPLNEERSVSTGGRVRVEDQGQASLRWSDFLLVRIFRNSDLAVDPSLDPSAPLLVKLRLGNGTVEAQAKLSTMTQQRLHVVTDSAEIEVTGTTFFVHHDPQSGVTWIVVQQGELRVSAVGRDVLVPGGMQTWVEPGQPPRTPVPATRAMIGARFADVGTLTGGALGDADVLAADDLTPTVAAPQPSTTATSTPTDTSTATASATATSAATETETATTTPTAVETVTPTATVASVPPARPTATRASPPATAAPAPSDTPTQVPPTSTGTPTRPPPTRSPTRTPCPPLGNVRLSATRLRTGDVELAWNWTGGCAPYAGTVTARLDNARQPYRTLTVNDPSATASDKTPIHCGSVIYTLTATDGMGGSRTTTASAQTFCPTPTRTSTPAPVP